MSSKKKANDYIYVGVQFLLFIIYLIPCANFDFAPVSGVKILGGILIALGIFVGLAAIVQLGKGLSPFPTPTTDGVLIQTGVFRYSRHPIYTAILGVFWGYGMCVGSGYKLLVTIALLILFFFKSSYEEVRLSDMFEGYARYKKRTRRFF